MEADDSRANHDDRDGMAESPESPDERRFRQRFLPAHNGGNRDDVVRVRGMAHAQKKSNQEYGESAHRGSPASAGQSPKA